MNSRKVDNQHSEVGPSSIADIILCPGRVRMQRGLENKSSFAAAQGTVAHKIGEDKLQGKRFPPKGGMVTEDGHAIDIDDEMIGAVKIYIDHINEIRQATGLAYAAEGIEVFGDMSWLGMPEVFGTADYVMSIPFKTLYVRDYKHGAGVQVDVEDNPQLMTYALIAGGEMIETYDTINLAIVQPRGGGETVKVWETEPERLMTWAEDVLKPAVRLALSSDAPLVPGEKQCRWCRAQGICPAIAKQALQVAQADFTDFSDIRPDEVVDGIPIEKVLQIYEQLPLLKTFIKAVEGRVFGDLEAGNPVPGYKLVHGRASRSWKNEDAVVALLRSKKIEPYEYKILSPAKVEKALGKSKNEVSDLIQIDLGSPTIARDDDPRKTISTAQEDFANI